MHAVVSDQHAAAFLPCGRDQDCAYKFAEGRLAIPSSRLTGESHEITGLERAVCEDSRNADAHHLLASSTPNSLGGLAVSNNLTQQQRCVDISNKGHDVVP